MSWLVGFGVGLFVIAVVVRILRCLGAFGVEFGSSVGATHGPMLYLECGYAWGASSNNWRMYLLLWWLVTRFGLPMNLVVGFLLLGIVRVVRRVQDCEGVTAW